MNRILAAAILATFSLSAFAATETENVLVVKPATTVVEGSSEHMRLGKQYTLDWETGFAVAPIPSSGLAAGYFLDRNSLILISATSGKLTLLGSNTANVDISAKTATVDYKYFFGNSFYTRGGAGYREVGVEAWGLFDSSVRVNGVSKSVVADLAIGNQWQWENFTLGCDWIGVMAPVATIQGSYDSSVLTGDARKKADDSWNEVAKITTTQFLRFYLGASF